MNDTTPSGPREILTPYRSIPLDVPEGMKHNEFFNSTENLNDLVNNNGLLVNPENLLLYRKALGHSTEFDCSIIYNIMIWGRSPILFTKNWFIGQLRG
jgi:hypothetical protein